MAKGLGRRDAVITAGIDRHEPFEIYKSPGHLIRRLNQIWMSLYLQKTTDFGVTSLEYAALTAIRAHPGIDQRGLARLCGFDKSTAGTIVDQLERTGLAVRYVSREDARFREIYISQSGAEIVRNMRPVVRGVQTKLLASLEPEERTELLRLLTKLADVNNNYSRAPLEKTLPERTEK